MRTDAERLLDATSRYQHAQAMTRASFKAVLQERVVVSLAARRALRAKLDAMWAWFDAHPDHDRVDERTEVFLRTLARYDALDGALTEAKLATMRTTPPTPLRRPTGKPRSWSCACGAWVVEGWPCPHCGAKEGSDAARSARNEGRV